MLDHDNVCHSFEHCICGRYGQCTCANAACLQACPETPEAYQCVRCTEGTYNFKAGSTCNTCPSTGAICRGGFNGSAGVSAKRNYYGYIAPESNDYDLSIFLCPANQCCQYESCVVNGTDECPATRDPKSPLCGNCNRALSETLGSVECQQCSGTNWLLIMGFLVLLGTLAWYLHSSAANGVAAEAAVSQIIVTKCLAFFYQVCLVII